MKKVLFVVQPKAQCGVYEFGYWTGRILFKISYNKLIDNEQDFYYYECVEASKPEDLYERLKNKSYCFVIYNHHPLTMSWLNNDVITTTKLPSAVIMHDERKIFNNTVILHPDPTYISNGIDYKVGRPIPFFYPENMIRDENGYYKIAPVLENTIGTFGFGFNHKGFDEVVHKVNEEFDEATVRIRLPLNTIVDSSGSYAYSMRNRLEKIPVKHGIKLEFSHEYLDSQQLLYWLAQNTANVFMYRNSVAHNACSSVIDWAIAAGRPIAVSNDGMFHHVHKVEPSICLCKNTLKTIIQNGTVPLEPLYKEWSWENLYQDYGKVINESLCTQG